MSLHNLQQYHLVFLNLPDNIEYMHGIDKVVGWKGEALYHYGERIKRIKKAPRS